MPKTKGTIRCVCVRCGAEFFEYPYRAAIRQFCSRPCQDAGLQGRAKPPRSPEHRAKLSEARKAYATARRRPPKVCADCTAEITPHATRCRACAWVIENERRRSPENRQRVSDLSRRIWETPGVRERIRVAGQERMRTPEARARTSAEMKAIRNRPDIRAMFEGENHPNWMGGASAQTHKRVVSPEWQQFRRLYRQQHSSICELCGRPGHVLHHRIPVRVWPEGEFVESNIQVLCGSCHAKVEAAIRRAERANAS